MPQRIKKAAVKSRNKISGPVETAPVAYDMGGSQYAQPETPPEQSKKINTKAGIIILLIVLAVIFLLRKGYIVSAVVNGRPIFTWELNNVMVNRFGKQTLEGIITEQLIYQEAAKQGVSVTPAEVQAREDEMVKNIGADVKLEDLLKYQGLTRSDFDNQIKLQMIVEKILGKDISYTDAQLDNFVATNSAALTATDSASKREEARTILTEQEINKKITTWLQDLKDKAKITRFL